MLVASRAKKRPPGASTRHTSSSIAVNSRSSRAKCSTALQMTASDEPSSHGGKQASPVNVVGRQRWVQRRHELTNRANGGRVCIHRSHVEAVSQEI